MCVGRTVAFVCVFSSFHIANRLLLFCRRCLVLFRLAMPCSHHKIWMDFVNFLEMNVIAATHIADGMQRFQCEGQICCHGTCYLFIIMAAYNGILLNVSISCCVW